MYEKNDKRRLYQLLDMYLTQFITAPVFCDEFYYSYSLEIDDTRLTPLEQETFSQLEVVASRFSQFEEDHAEHPGVYFTELELRQKILKTKEELKTQNILQHEK